MISGIGNNQGSLLRTYSKGTDMPMPMGRVLPGQVGGNTSGPRLPVPARVGGGVGVVKPDILKKAKQAGQRKAMLGNAG